MAPAALAIPQYINERETHPNTEWNNNKDTMDGALDFDLLAEYLLEDVGAGGFDFG